MKGAFELWDIPTPAVLHVPWILCPRYSLRQSWSQFGGHRIVRLAFNWDRDMMKWRLFGCVRPADRPPLWTWACEWVMPSATPSEYQKENYGGPRRTCHSDKLWYITSTARVINRDLIRRTIESWLHWAVQSRANASFLQCLQRAAFFAGDTSPGFEGVRTLCIVCPGVSGLELGYLVSLRWTAQHRDTPAQSWWACGPASATLGRQPTSFGPPPPASCTASRCSGSTYMTKQTL